MSTEAKHLRTRTRTFFKRHWNDELHSQPDWQVWELSSPLPEGELGHWHSKNMGGCYAVFAGDKLVYVGLALTPGWNPKEGQRQKGILDRLKRHVIERSGQVDSYNLKETTRSRWDLSDLVKYPVETIQIHVIAFPERYRYLAAALETFLIWDPKLTTCNKTVSKVSAENG